MSNYVDAVKSLFASWLTPKLLADAEPAFTEPAIRSYIFNADDRHSSEGIIQGNGLAPHIRRVGSKVLINHGGFLSWIDANGTTGRKRAFKKVEKKEDASLMQVAAVVPQRDREHPSSIQGRRRQP